jgi:hypothetical protein
MDLKGLSIRGSASLSFGPKGGEGGGGSLPPYVRGFAFLDLRRGGGGSRQL